MTISKALKVSVWNTYIGEEVGKSKCYCCNITDITQSKFHCGHVVAKKNGGDNSIENLKPICELCNKSMKTKNLEEFKNTLNFTPKEKTLEEKYDECVEEIRKILPNEKNIDKDVNFLFINRYGDKRGHFELKEFEKTFDMFNPLHRKVYQMSKQIFLDYIKDYVLKTENEVNKFQTKDLTSGEIKQIQAQKLVNSMFNTPHKKK